MKTKFTISITIVVSILSLYGCKMKCDFYAPGGSDISWNNYNSVERVHNYFKYYNTAEQHLHDTIKMCGYIIGDGDTNYYRSEYDNADGDVIWVHITDDPNDVYDGQARGGKLSMPIGGSLKQMEWLKEYTKGQKVYVTGFCHTADPEDDRGCYWTTIFHVINVFVSN